MNAIKTIIENASKLNGTIVLPEGMDARVVTAACACVDRKICKPIVLGTKEEIALAEASVGLSMAARGIKVILRAILSLSRSSSKLGTLKSLKSRPRSSVLST